MLMTPRPTRGVIADVKTLLLCTKIVIPVPTTMNRYLRIIVDKNEVQTNFIRFSTENLKFGYSKHKSGIKKTNLVSFKVI